MAPYIRLAPVRYVRRELFIYGYTWTLFGAPPKIWTQFDGPPELRVLYEGARHFLEQRIQRPCRKKRLPVP